MNDVMYRKLPLETAIALVRAACDKLQARGIDPQSMEGLSVQDEVVTICGWLTDEFVDAALGLELASAKKQVETEVADNRMAN